MKIANTLSQADIIKYKIPTTCPVCGGSLKMRDNLTKLYCDNSNCSTQFVARLNKWMSVLDVKGFGPALIGACASAGLNSICQLYSDEAFRSRMAEEWGVNAQKAWTDLFARTNLGVSTAKFIAGFNIPGIGVELAQTIVDAGKTIEDFFNLTVTDLVDIPGWSETRATVLINGIRELEEDMKNCLNGYVPIKDEHEKVATSSISGLHICVTGKLEKFSRKDIESFLKKHGAISDASVTKLTDILVTNDTTTGSSKLKNAAKFGTKIINETELLELTGGV